MVTSGNEKALMLLITGITNFACFPALYVLYKKGLHFQFQMGIFTFITSFMYHSLESIGWDGLYIDRGTWHKLDNIGSICCFIMLFVYWMDNLHEKNGQYYSKHVVPADIHLNTIGLFIVLLMQAKHAWRLENTIIPILIFIVLFILKLIFIGKSRFNRYYLTRGVGILLVAVYFFSKGLDEHSDYLRFYHGMWHCFVGFSSFFLWQSIDKDRADDTKILKCAYQTRFTFWSVLKHILFLGFDKESINKVY